MLKSLKKFLLINFLQSIFNIDIIEDILFIYMKKNILSFLFLLLISSKGFSALMVENLNITVNAANPTANITPSFVQSPLFSVNYFAAPGSISIIGKNVAQFKSKLVADLIIQNNYHPTRLYNNSNASGYRNYYTSPIFFSNNSLGFVNRFSGLGNQYIAGQAIFTEGDTINFWILVNLSEDASELKIVKIGYEDVSGKFPQTGTEGMNIPMGVNENLASKLNIYPQPANDAINIEMLGKQIVSSNLFNLNGDLIAQYGLTANRIEVAHLSKGVYILQVKCSEGIVTKKVIIGE